MDKKAIGEFITELRNRKKISQEQLAKDLGEKLKTVQKLEKGKIRLNTKLLIGLSKEFNVKATDIINGYEGKGKEDECKAVLTLDNMYQRARKIQKAVRVLSCLIIVVLFGLFIYMNANKDFGYELHGETDNFLYADILFLRDNGYYYIIFGTPTIKNSEITEDNITRVTLKCGDRLIISSNRFIKDSSREKQGYDELFPKEVVKNIDNWYYEIEYNIDKKTYTDTIKLEASEL